MIISALYYAKFKINAGGEPNHEYINARRVHI
jgi:hypothetical protein